MEKVLSKKCLQCKKVFYKGRNVSIAEWFGSKRRPKGVQYCSRKCKCLALRKKDIKYSGIHCWIRRNLEKPYKCEHCGIENLKRSNGDNSIEWANISGSFKRDRDDWLHLCPKCHRKYDREK